MSSQQKRSHEADCSQPNKRQDMGPPKSGQEDSSVLSEELLSNGRDESQLLGHNQWPSIYSQMPSAFSQMPSGQGDPLRQGEISSNEMISGASNPFSEIAPEDEVSNRLDVLRADHERLRADHDQLKLLVAGPSSPLEKSVIADLIERVQALERESKRDLLAENERLSQQVEAITASRDQAEAETAQLRREVNAATVSRDQAVTEAEQLRDDNRRLEMTVATKVMELANLRSEKEQLARSLHNTKR
ncbi:unnamed protein product [Fusarium equiseti]|uniref:Uncharacterized protein n=1 Tax=Fusarium equiseti TaxID=61235 RepID=A0A8J2NJ38_FUSEQ|nr:unnamed protein product [Fusarium equiseti]